MRVGWYRLSIAQLGQMKGIGTAKAAELMAAVELGRRMAAHSAKQKLIVTCPEDAAEYAFPRFNHKKGDKVNGAIKSITDFGVFIGLPGNIDGLVHLSDLSWTEAGETAVHNFKKGDELEAVVLAIDVERERVSLGVNQLEGDPFNNYIAMNDKGAVVNGVVKSVEPKGAVIQLNDEVEGYLRASEISRDRVEDAGTQLKVDDKVEVMIINIDRKSRTLQLSIKAKDQQETQEAMQKIQSDSSAASGMTSLGALLKAKFDNK